MAGMNELAKLSGCTPQQVNDVFDAIMNLIRNGDNVVIRNFGSFREVIQKERIIHSTALEGGQATVPEAKVLRFRPSPATKIKTKAKAKARKAKAKK